MLIHFNRAERTGNWKHYLHSFKKMIYLLAVTGHMHYPKFLRLYPQKISELNIAFPWIYKRFSGKDLFCVWRSDRCCGGSSTGLAIEHVLMRSIESRRKLKRGRGVIETVKTTYVKSMLQYSA